MSDLPLWSQIVIAFIAVSSVFPPLGVCLVYMGIGIKRDAENTKRVIVTNKYPPKN